MTNCKNCETLKELLKRANDNTTKAMKVAEDYKEMLVTTSKNLKRSMANTDKLLGKTHDKL